MLPKARLVEGGTRGSRSQEIERCQCLPRQISFSRAILRTEVFEHLPPSRKGLYPIGHAAGSPHRSAECQSE